MYGSRGERKGGCHVSLPGFGGGGCVTFFTVLSIDNRMCYILIVVSNSYPFLRLQGSVGVKAKCYMEDKC